MACGLYLIALNCGHRRKVESMSLKIKVEPGTPFTPAGMPTNSTREECQVRPCPLEIDAELVGDPKRLGLGLWRVDIFPVKVEGGFPGYYSHVDPDKITVDGKRFYIVKVMETHCVSCPTFAVDVQKALSNAQESCGDGPSEYVETQSVETWEVTLPTFKVQQGIDATVAIKKKKEIPSRRCGPTWPPGKWPYDA